MNKSKMLPIQKTIGKEVQEEVSPQGDAITFFRSKIEEFIPNKNHLDSMPDMAFHSFKYDRLVKEAFLEEVEQII